MTDFAATKIACIGGGYWGKNLILNFNALDALSWVCEVEPATRDHLKQKYPGVRFTESVNEVLADSAVAGVVIATARPANAYYAGKCTEWRG
jgi:UDP-2-acetamido-3-amino-2,3-dideoxy-glucuronate N-acetyltransferase